MSEFTKEQLIGKLKHRIAVTEKYPDVEEAQLEAVIFRIALASLIAEPIGAFHIYDQQVGGTSDYIKDGEWPIDDGIIEVYSAPPAPVVSDEISESLASVQASPELDSMQKNAELLHAAQPAQDESLETLKRLAVIMHGAEIDLNLLTVTAQALVDRCKKMEARNGRSESVSPILQCFYIAYSSWLKSGAAGVMFSTGVGLCANAHDFFNMIGIDGADAQEEMHAAFVAAGMDERLPFNDSPAHYTDEQYRQECHVNPARTAWVESYASK